MVNDIDLDTAVAAWTAVQSGFEIMQIHAQGEPGWQIEDRLRDEVRIMQMAIRAFVALRELSQTLLDHDVRSLVIAACGTGPFTIGEIA